jgi:cytoskeletal protein CcmA (bactofilin family)
MKAFKSNGEEAGQGRISRGVEVAGDVHFADDLQVGGKLSGRVISENGSLMIEQAGDVQADIEVGVCVIRGAVRGNVTASARVEIYKTATVQGDITTPVLLVEEGALLSGAITMGKETARPPEEVRTESNDDLRQSKSAS